MIENNKAEEPFIEYKTKRISLFYSFEEMEQDRISKMAQLTAAQRLAALSRNRKRIFKSILLPDGTMPPFKRVIKISNY